MTEFADVSMERIHTLNSKLIESAINVLRKCLKQKLPIHILWGSRTLEQQDLLYRFGRTLHGSIITHRRPGYSAHNFGLALDFCLSEGTRLLTWDECFADPEKHKMWFRVVQIFEAEGWESGWRWPSFEPGHMQKLMGHTIGELHVSYKQDEDRNNRD
jgi:peptidoglycan LD-endopeptidase CwlK